jgi:hypothetical protein
MASRESTVFSCHALPSYLREGDAKAFRQGNLHMIATIQTVFADVFDHEIRSENHFAAHFHDGIIGSEIGMKPWPASADETARMAAMSRQQEQQKSQDNDEN